MKKATTLILALALGALAAQTASAASTVRISQVYGGGGGGSGTYIYDYVELFNSSGAAVNIGGWSLQYGSATGSSFASSATNMAVLPAGVSIKPCGYYLVQVGAAGTGGVAFPVTPDLVSTGPSMSATTGKIALVSNSTFPHPCSGHSIGGDYVDVVGYGTANCFETANAGTTSNTTVAVRKIDGMQDSDNNSVDFVVQGTNITTIHNSSSAANPDCLATPAMPNTWGKIKVLYR